MFAFILRRSVQTAIVMVAVVSIALVLFQYVGGSVVFPLGQGADPAWAAAYLCLVALTFVIINLVADLLYFAAGPRLRVASAKGH